MAITKSQAKEIAKTLYVKDDLHQKVIAERVGVTEKTIGKWISEGEWKKLKTSLLTTKENQISNLYSQLEKINTEINTRPITYDIPAYLLKPVKLKNTDGTDSLSYPKFNPKDFPVKLGNFPTNGEADIISKITSSIKKLETETGLGETFSVVKELLGLIQQEDLDLAKRVTIYCDTLIQTKSKNAK